jgi:hypothetical protein
MKMRTHNVAGSTVGGLVSQGLAFNSLTSDLNLEGYKAAGWVLLNEVKMMLKIRKEWTLSAKSKLLKENLSWKRLMEDAVDDKLLFISHFNGEP